MNNVSPNMKIFVRYLILKERGGMDNQFNIAANDQPAFLEQWLNSWEKATPVSIQESKSGWNGPYGRYVEYMVMFQRGDL